MTDPRIRQRRRRTANRWVTEYNVIREIHRSGVTVLNDPDVEWFAWHPRTQTIALQPTFGPTFKRGTVTLALAHRALGHWGLTMRQDMEARELTARWLINDESAAYAIAAVPTIGVGSVARQLGVTPHVLQVRLQLGECRCLTNVDIFHGQQCECGAIPMVAPFAGSG
jgi:hypothetical protein